MAAPTPRSAVAKPILAAIIAGFIAIMLAGPGMMVPGHFRLWSPLVCRTLGSDARPRVETYQQMQHNRGRTTGFRFHCVRPDGSGADVSFRAILIAFSGYFLLLFIGLSVALRKVDLSASPSWKRRR